MPLIGYRIMSYVKPFFHITLTIYALVNHVDRWMALKSSVSSKCTGTSSHLVARFGIGSLEIRELMHK